MQRNNTDSFGDDKLAKNGKFLFIMYGSRGWVVLMSLIILLGHLFTMVYTVINTKGVEITFSKSVFTEPVGSQFISNQMLFFSVDPIYLVKITSSISILYILTLVLTILSSDSKVLSIDMQTFHVVFKMIMMVGFSIVIPPICFITDVKMLLSLIVIAAAVEVTVIVERIYESREWSNHQWNGDHQFIVYSAGYIRNDEQSSVLLSKILVYTSVAFGLAVLNCLWVIVVLWNLLTAYDQLSGVPLWPLLFVFTPVVFALFYHGILMAYRDNFISSSILELKYQFWLYGTIPMALEWVIYFYYTSSDVWVSNL
jgi:hypothetical protein